MESLYLGGPTIQEVDGEMMMGLSIYGVAVMDGSLYSRFYGTYRAVRISYLVRLCRIRRRAYTSDIERLQRVITDLLHQYRVRPDKRAQRCNVY